MPSPTAVSDALARGRRFIATPWSGDSAADDWTPQRLVAPVLPAMLYSELKLTASGFVARSWLIPLDDEGDDDG